jgi:hypothetical protein
LINRGSLHVAECVCLGLKLAQGQRKQGVQSIKCSDYKCTYHQVYIDRSSVELEAFALGSVLLIVVRVRLVVVTLAFVGFGHALARTCEADCKRLAIDQTRDYYHY